MKRDKTGATPDNGWQVNADQIKQMVKEIEKMGGTWEKFTDPPKKKNPPILIPTVWTTPPRGHELDEDWEKKQEEQELVAFMQECRERTADMKDEEKCERCKLRFRCYTEIKIEKKRKTKTGGVTRIGRKQPIIFRAQTFTSQQAAEFPAPEFDWAKVIHDIGKSSESDSQTKSPSNNH